MVKANFDDLQNKLINLFLEFKDGQHFHDLDDQLRQFKQRVPYKKQRTPVNPATDEDGKVVLLLNLLTKRMASKTKKAWLSDSELKLLLTHISILDEKIRDRGLFLTFNALTTQQILTADQVHMSIGYLLQEGVLFSHILEPENEAVCERSMAVLLLAYCLMCEREYDTRILTTDEYQIVVMRLALYALLENDTRGYIDGLGWSHTFGRLGNVLAEVNESKANRAEKLFLVTATLVGYQEQRTAFTFGEDAMLAAPIVDLTRKEKFYSNFVINLLDHWLHLLPHRFGAQGSRFWNRFYNRGRFFTAILLNPHLPYALSEFIGKKNTDK